ncbi:hypothetical protein Pelo_18696 [Pelomyxa schiedti]|nr:hypothetical protein Pelo_18696 [Pelomyxa schiedti]
MSAGKMEVVKWMSEKFGLGRNLHQTAFSYLYYSCAWSPCSTRNLKWCLENFPGEPNMSILTSAIVRNKHSTVEDLQWACVGEYFPSRCYEYMLYSVHNPDVVKWLLTTFPPHPSEDELNHVCMNTGNVELTQWLVTEQGFTPTAETFESACSTSRKKGSTLAKWLSTRVSLSQNDIIKSLVCALRWSNIEVAEWLDEAFHVMDVVNSSPKFAEYCLVERGKEYNKDKVGYSYYAQVLVLLLLLTSEFVGHCLTSQEFHPYSSKVVKWVIRKFNVQYTQIKANNNHLLFKLISRNKNRCAQWLINTFDIPLDDILSMAQLSDDNCIDLTGWHMILNHYGPTIDATLIRKHLMPLVSRSPHVAIHTISSFGLTIHEYRDYVQQGGKRGEPFSSQVKLWLGIPL